MISKAVLAFLIGASALVAADFWQTKQPSDWTDKEAQRLMTSSPWARELNLSMSRPGGGFGGADASAGGSGWGGGQGEMDSGRGGSGRGGGRGGRSGGGSEFERAMPSLHIVVRFESAAPVRAAATRRESKANDSIADWSKEFYVVTMSGLPMGRDADQDRMARLAQGLKAAATLAVKGKDPVQPGKIAAIPSAAGPIWAFLFPRNAITVEDKDVTFQSKVMRFDIKAKFALKDMVYQGKLEL